MTFQSLSFVVFVAGAAASFWLASQRWKGSVLLAVSYAFYATWSIAHAVLLIALTVMVHSAALAIQRAPDEAGKRRVMAAGVVVLLAVMAAFKYFADAQSILAHGPLGGNRFSALHIVAPLGLSYYIFKLVGYLVDVYWEKIPAERSLLAVANLASFFPQMMAGPIQRAGDFFTQTSTYANPAIDVVWSGLRLVLFGFFKKLVVADQIGMMIDPLFGHLKDLAPAQLLLVLYLFPIQLYADFSGITDIAIGIGRFFGIESPPNFDSPFYAPNIADYWRRWHMSLSSWLRDYVFTPLQYATRGMGNAGLVFSLMTTMVAIGLWHGARSSYLVFGLINGIYMSVSALTLKRRNRWFKAHPAFARIRRVAGPLLLFHLMIVALVFFRAPAPSGALFAIVHGVPAVVRPWALVGLISSLKVRLAIAMAGAAAMELGHFARRHDRMNAWFFQRPIWVRWVVYYGTALAVVLLGVFTTKTFIYEQF